jgi:hypothetical protein
MNTLLAQYLYLSYHVFLHNITKYHGDKKSETLTLESGL